MSRYSKKPAPSPETRDEAMKIAKGTQKPGQTKEQTKLIAQGIQKGIDQYKKKQKAKTREIDKKLKSAKTLIEDGMQKEHETQIIYRQHWLPWLLLVLSWIGAALYIFLFSSQST
jgi:hypothetical protein